MSEEIVNELEAGFDVAQIDMYATGIQNEEIDAIVRSSQKKLILELATIEEINNEASKVHMYDTKKMDCLHPNSHLPFRISPDVFELPENVDLGKYGHAISGFYSICKKLYSQLDNLHRWKQYLDHSKPQWMLNHSNIETGDHVFLRPDLVLTQNGPIVTEIETSPFGLGLSYFLDNVYKHAGKDTLTDEQNVLNLLRSATRGSLSFVLTLYTKQYEGQFRYLSNELFSKTGIKTAVTYPDNGNFRNGQYVVEREAYDSIYRCFYLHQTINNAMLRDIAQFKSTVPICLPQMEEKAVMGMIWDSEFDDYFRNQLGEDTYNLLKKIIPKTWVLDANHIPDELDIKEWEDLANISQKRRSFVFKPSGFTSNASWAKGVVFLNKLSKQQCRKTINDALVSKELFILQEFKKGAKFQHRYFDFHSSEMKNMNGKVRITPYYSVKDGKLLTAKATICENTDIVHAMVDSINVPVVKSGIIKSEI